jgi:hypothetical protein
MPPDLRALELLENGTWAVSLDHGFDTRALLALKNALQLSVADLQALRKQPCDDLCPGTRAEAERLVNCLREAHVSARCLRVDEPELR